MTPAKARSTSEEQTLGTPTQASIPSGKLGIMQEQSRNCALDHHKQNGKRVAKKDPTAVQPACCGQKEDALRPRGIAEVSANITLGIPIFSGHVPYITPQDRPVYHGPLRPTPKPPTPPPVAPTARRPPGLFGGVEELQALRSLGGPQVQVHLRPAARSAAECPVPQKIGPASSLTGIIYVDYT